MRLLLVEIMHLETRSVSVYSSFFHGNYVLGDYKQ